MVLLLNWAKLVDNSNFYGCANTTMAGENPSVAKKQHAL
jgi:hypothetical protein